LRLVMGSPGAGRFGGFFINSLLESIGEKPGRGGKTEGEMEGPHGHHSAGGDHTVAKRRGGGIGEKRRGQTFLEKKPQQGGAFRNAGRGTVEGRGWGPEKGPPTGPDDLIFSEWGGTHRPPMGHRGGTRGRQGGAA